MNNPGLNLIPGNDLLSQPVSRQVPLALKGLTAVFGMERPRLLPSMSPRVGTLLPLQVVPLAIVTRKGMNFIVKLRQIASPHYCIKSLPFRLLSGPAGENGPVHPVGSTWGNPSQT